MAQLHKKSKLKNPTPPAHDHNGRKSIRKKGQRRKDPTEGLSVANPNAAAIDIGSAEHWVAVPPGRCPTPVRRFGCCTADLKALADWLKDCGVDTVVLEATGNYWVALYDLLEE